MSDSEDSTRAADVSLFDPATLQQPYEAYQTLRDHDPVHFVPGMNLHVITRYDLLREAIRDTKTYSSKFDGFLGAAQQMMFAAAPADVQAELLRINGEMIVLPPTMLTLDEPEHTQYRSLVSKLFTVSEIKRSEVEVQATIDRAIQSFIGSSGDIDFMEAFANPVPLEIISVRLGIPEEDRAFFYQAATAGAAALRLSPIAPEEMVRRAQLALDLQRLLVRLIEARRVEPRADMISILATSKLEEANRHLTHGECLSILNQFLVAGHETTTSTFGWGMLHLCRTPGLQDEIRGDAKLIKTFVEEALRLESPVQGLPRLVTQDTELGGCPLKAGQLVMLRYGAANRDERQFERADEIDVHRDKAGMQMAFGSGVHHCIGAPLARQELNLGFMSLLAAMKDIRLAAGTEPMAEPSFILRNLPTLPIAFARR
ncbi:MAG: cytochrome P450 [Gammaproteobacteria bacterium]|nr:cytochrome P450 [Gammaproteobacteria bacterium]